MAINTTRFPLRSTQPRSATMRRVTQPPRPSDDEILGLVTAVARPEATPAVPQVGKVSTHKSAPVVPHENGPIATAPHVTGARLAEPPNSQSSSSDAAPGTVAEDDAQGTAVPQAGFVLTPEIAQVLDAHPQPRAAWDTAQQFESIFSSPAAAQDAKSQLDELDGMFFSGDPSAQAALAARIHELSPEAFHSLTQAMQAHAAKAAAENSGRATSSQNVDTNVSFTRESQNSAAPAQMAPASQGLTTGAAVPSSGRVSRAPTVEAKSGAVDTTPSVSPATTASRSGDPSAAQSAPELQGTARRAAQLAFFHSTNSAAVHQVLAAIESQVTHLLPASASAATRTRIVGEIYRDVGSALSSNRQLGHQLREAFRSGAGDVAHQRTIVALVAGRARQALPSIARRVINEWTHGVVSANQEKHSRQSASAKRVDISGAASSDGVNRRAVSPRDVDYKRLSDADILNL